MMYWYNGMNGWGYLFMAVSMVLFWGLVIAGIVVLVRTVGGGRRSEPGPDQTGPDPARLLAQRLASGEISEDEYRSRMQTLTRH